MIDCQIPKCGDEAKCTCDACSQQVCRAHFHKAPVQFTEGGTCSTCQVASLRAGGYMREAKSLAEEIAL